MATGGSNSQGTLGQQIGPTLFSAAGSAIGSYLGGPVGGAIGGMAGGLIGTLIFGRVKAKPLIPDLNVMNSAYGNPIPILWGTARLPGTVTWLSVVQITEHGVGKGGLNNTAYSYHQDGSINFCEGPGHLVKIYLDGKLFLDKTSTLGELTKDNKYHFTVREYTGTEDQLPDYRYLIWLKGQGKENQGPGYRGMCYLVFQEIDLVGWGGRFPQVSAVWSTNEDYTTFFTQMSPIAGISNDKSTLGIASDWQRNVTYQVSRDGTLRTYDLATGLNIATNPFCFPGAEQVSAGNGTYVYAWDGSRIAVIDPLNLEVISTIDYSVPLFGIRLSPVIQQLHVINLGVANQAYSAITGQLGTGDMYVAESILGDIGGGGGTIDYGGGLGVSGGTGLGDGGIGGTSGLSGIVVGPPFQPSMPGGGIIRIYNDAAQVGVASNLTFSDLLHRVNIVFGNHDFAKQTTDVWFTNTSDFDNTGTMALWRYTSDTPSGAYSLYGGVISARIDINEPFLYREFHPDDFGLPTDTGTAAGIGGLLFDPSDETLIITGATFARRFVTFKYDPATNGVVWFILDPPPTISGPAMNWELSQGRAFNSFNNFDPDTGFLTTSVTALDLLTGEVSDSPVAVADGLRASALGNGNFNSNSNTLVFIDRGTNLPWVATLFRKTGTEVPVAHIITDICGRVGVDSSMIDVSQIDLTVWGYVINTPKSAGAALADLCHVFNIDMVESDYLLKFIPRGQAIVASLVQDELASLDPEDGSKYWVPRHAQEQDMPLLLNIKYVDPDLDYQPGATYAKRTALPVPTVFSKRKLSIDLPIVANNLEASQIAERWLYTMWAERETYQTTLSPKYLWLDPTDNITVLLDNGDSYTARIESTEIGADFAMRPSLASEDATVYGTSSTRGAEFGRIPQTIIQAPYGELLQFNAPLLQDSDDLGNVATRIYFAVGANSATWRGGGLYNAIDGATWNSLATLPRPVDWGHAINVLGDTVAAFCTDYANTLNVSFTPGSAIPSSCAYLDLMNGANPVLVGSEIIQFQTITDNLDGTYELSVLARGRRGTEWATGRHNAGEVVIMLGTGALGGSRLSLDQINQRELWRLVPTGWFLDQAPARPFRYLGDDLKPYAPVNFTRTVVGSDLELGWIRRTRIGGLLTDGIDTVPLNEQSEGYEAYILDREDQFVNFNPVPSATAHRYWRLLMSTKSPGVSFYGMAELEFRDVAGTGRSFSGGAASDDFSGTPNDPTALHGANACTDGNTATWWLSAFGDADWWMYDYGAGHAANVVEVVITAPSDISVGNGPVDFTLEYSDDNVTWIATENFHHDGWTAGQSVRFGPYRRAFTGLASPSLTYTAAQMTADGFDLDTDTLWLVVYQLSAVIGRGFAGFQELPAF
jgi:hypothetical protein